MRATLMKKLRSFRSADEGVTLVEYGIALILAVTVGTTTLAVLGTDVGAKMTEASNCLTGANASC